MTATLVGTIWQARGVNRRTLAVSPDTVGDALCLSIALNPHTLTVSAVSGGGATDWQRVAGPIGYTIPFDQTVELWVGRVIGTGSSTITITASGSSTGTDTLMCGQFTTGAACTWARDGSQSGTLTGTPSTTVTWPPLIPASSGELYWGYSSFDQTGLTTGQTSGYTVVLDAAANPYIYNGSISGPQAPTSQQTPAGSSVAVAAIIIGTPITVSTKTADGIAARIGSVARTLGRTKTADGAAAGIGSVFRTVNTLTKRGPGAAAGIGLGTKAGRIKTTDAAARGIGSAAQCGIMSRTADAIAARIGSAHKVRERPPKTASAVAARIGSGHETLIRFQLFSGNPAPPGAELLVVPYVPPTHAGLRFIARNIIDGAVVDWDLPILLPEITWTLSGPTVIKGSIAPENIDVVEEKIDAWATWLDVEQDGVIRASGIVQPVAISDETFEIEAIGVAGYPAGMPFLSELSEIQFDTLDAVRRIWAHLLSYPDAVPLNVELSQNTCGLLLGTPATIKTDASGAIVTDASGAPVFNPPVPYELNWWSDIDCGREIDQLAKTVPFDYVENPVWSPDRDYVIHRIELGFPRAGRLRTDLRFVLDENMLAVFVVREEPGTYASTVLVRGKGEGRDGIRGYAGTTTPRRLRRVAMITDKVIQDQLKANARAADELRRRQTVLTVGEIVIHDWHSNAPIGSFAVGDDIVIQAPISYLGDVALTHRITAYTWAPDEGKITLALARVEDFYYGREPSTINALFLSEHEEEPVADVPITVLGDNSFVRTVMVECGTSSLVIAQMWLTYGVIDGTAHFVLQAYGGNGAPIGSAYAGDPFAAHGSRTVDLADKARTYMTLPSGAVMVKVSGYVSAGAHPAMATVLSPKR